MTAPSFIRSYAEPLGDGRAVMRVDVIVDGALDHSYLDGSPAPIDTVRQYETTETIR